MTDFKKYPKIFALGKEDNEDIFKYGKDEIIVQDSTNLLHFVMSQIKNNFMGRLIVFLSLAYIFGLENAITRREKRK